MMVSRKRNKYGLHAGWGKLFKDTLDEYSLQDIYPLSNSHGEYDIRELRTLHYESIGRVNSDLFSIDIANSISAFTFDCYSMMLWNAPNIKQLIYDKVEYFIYISPMIRLKIVEDKNDLEIWMFNNNSNFSDKVSNVGYITIISAILSILSRAAIKPIDKMQCFIPFNENSRNVIEEIESRFNIDVFNSHSSYYLRFPRAELNIKLKSSNDNLYKANLEYVKNIVNILNEDDFICKIYNILNEYSTLFNVNVNVVAAKLCISPRTLSRRLSALDTTFNIIFRNYRIELALRLLKETNDSLYMISYQLGFSEQSSFNHAFKRWTGYSPLHVRKSIMN
ncbi:TPA: helix-turn-helix transcriptional regulator [Photobacterium damselae]